MNKETALSIIKQVLDQAVKGGIFPNMDASFAAAEAFNVISKELLPQTQEAQKAE